MFLNAILKAADGYEIEDGVSSQISLAFRCSLSWPSFPAK